MADKNPPPPDLNLIKNAIIGDPSGRKSRVATTPLDPSGDTYMGASVGAKPNLSGSTEAPAAAPSGMEQMAAAAANLVGADGMAARRRNRQPRRTVDVDPAKLAEFTQTQATSEVVEEATAANPPAAAEKPSAISNLMAPSPEPSPEKAEPEITKEPTLAPEAKVPIPKQPSPKPVEPKQPSPKPAVVPEPKQLSPKPIAAPEPKLPPAAMLNTPAPTALPPKMDDASKQKLDIYDKICQKLVKDKDPSPQVLIGYLEPILKQELPTLQEKVKTFEKKVGEMTEHLAERDSTIANLKLKVAEAEKNAASVVAGSTANSLEAAAINDEDVNRLRGAFEEHMQNYQKSMDQFQSFFDKITQDLENTFTELGIEDNTNEAVQK